jgi:hypothetical protein
MIRGDCQLDALGPERNGWDAGGMSSDLVTCPGYRFPAEIASRTRPGGPVGRRFGLL